MDLTAVHEEKLQADGVDGRSGHPMAEWFASAVRSLTRAGGDALAAIFASVAAILAIPAPPSPFFGMIDRDYIPIVLGCCFMAGLYATDELNPLERLRRRARAVMGCSLIELFVVALQIPITEGILYVGARALLFFIFGFYIEYALESRFERNAACAFHSLRVGGCAPEGFRRAADAGVALVAMVLALPFLAASAAAIWLVDRGPVFYSQKRIGRGGQVINVLKIRTMYVDSKMRLEQRLKEDSAARAEWERFFKLRDDPRVLGWLGRFLRRSSLDELPQIWNILRGDMSLIGPRPFPQYHLDSFDEAFRQTRQSCKPGLTGLWQVSARSNGDLDVQKTLDLSYIDNRSLWLDLYILLLTVPAVVKGTGAR